MKLWWIAAIGVLLTFPAQQARPQADARAISATDTVFEPWNSTHSPGCAVGISRGGQVLLTRGYGMADLESGRPITGETVFESGSVAKQFTATAILLLARDGKLTLDDPVQKYIPEMPRYDRPITIRHLLTHTSGLREWSSLVGWAGWPRGSRAHTQADLLDVVFRQKALNYPVGDYYSYTNSGYAIAMSLVEKLSGQTFQQFTRERIFAPLGMTHTQWRDDFTRLVPGRAQAYTRRDGEWHLEMPFESVVGPGGMLTTVGDWLLWNEALTKNTLFPGHADSLTHRMRLTSGREITYALGLVVQKYRGRDEISHSGSTAGYSTYLARFPQADNLSIAVLCNSTSGNAGQYVHQLADRLIPNLEVATLDTGRVSAADVAPYLGVYQNARTRAPVEVTTESAMRMRALPGGIFWNGGNQRIRFEMSPSGAPVRMMVANSDGDTVEYRFVARDRWRPTPEQLRDYVGSFRSDEVGTTFQLAVVGDSLTMRLRPGQSVTLRPVLTDAFTGQGTTIWFSRDRSRRIDAMHLSESRMWDLVVPKVSR